MNLFGVDIRFAKKDNPGDRFVTKENCHIAMDSYSRRLDELKEFIAVRIDDLKDYINKNGR